MQHAEVGIRRADSCQMFVFLFLSPKTASAVCEYGDGAAFDDSAAFFLAHSLEHAKKPSACADGFFAISSEKR